MKEIIKKLGLDSYSITKNTVGRSASEVYKLQKADEVLYLKIGESSLRNLSIVLNFLNNTEINVPKLIKHGVFNDKYYVLMTECVGKMTYELEPELAVTVLAQELKKIHKLKYPEDILVMDVNHYQQKFNIIDSDKLSDEDKQFINNLDNLKIQDDLVFSHGDYCLPNILYDNGVTSLIDLDHACVTFRYSDIMDCIWSLEYNFKTDEYTSLFLREYGLNELDMVKVKEMKNIHRILEIKGY